MAEKVWSNRTTAVKARYLFFSNISLFAEFINSDIRGYNIDGRTEQQYLNMFTPPPYHGKNFTLVAGMQIGF
jgi:hypothetical protein